MKTLFLLVVALLLSFVPLWAQPDTNAIPKLEEICTVKAAIEKPSFYPDLGAKGSVIGLTTLDHVYDLSNPCALPFSKLFPCASSIAPRAGDFNGDGNVDYWMSGCGIVRGTGKGMLPRIDSIAPTYEYHNMSEGREVWDIDNDGNDDLSELGYYADAEPQRIIFGGKDLWNLESVSFPTTFGKVMEVYTRSDGSARALCSQRYDKKTDFPKRQIITLARLIVERQGEKRVIRLEKLSEFTYTEQSGGELSGYSELPGYMYHAKVKDEHTWVAYSSIGGTAHYEIFDLRNDTISFVRELREKINFEPLFLHKDVTGDTTEDWAMYYSYSSGTEYSPMIMIYSGSPTAISNPVGRFEQYSLTKRTVCAIEDITNDGIGDVFVAERGGYLTFLRGKPSVNGVIQEKSLDGWQILPPHSASPTVQLSVERPIRLDITLLTLDGRLIDKVSRDFVPGNYFLPDTGKPMARGTYLLRLNDGKRQDNCVIVLP